MFSYLTYYGCWQRGELELGFGLVVEVLGAWFRVTSMSVGWGLGSLTGCGCSCHCLDHGLLLGMVDHYVELLRGIFYLGFLGVYIAVDHYVGLLSSIL